TRHSSYPVVEAERSGQKRRAKCIPPACQTAQLRLPELFASRTDSIAAARELQTARAGLQVARQRAPSAIRALCSQCPCKLNDPRGRDEAKRAEFRPKAAVRCKRVEREWLLLIVSVSGHQGDIMKDSTSASRLWFIRSMAAHAASWIPCGILLGAGCGALY